ncbi:GNAT family N-acetyltransferase [Pontibacter sp. G13]|uniref:GNAT family N-acetyltransferase n=1 Tax=Pontibacter sp. G13 TaxID=3074898 RepID=UPI00288B1817|nr:GNAT family N-acetyltransferase [Pontibacter sp. G13]WNJ20309.1 GNAT family N-acetyltransferase [Pontibacter sp. G13]
MRFKTFETDRLQLIPTSETDAEFVLRLMNTPKWIQFIGDRNVHTLEDARAYIQKRMRPQLERLGYSNYTVIRKDDGMKIGSCGLYDREGLEGIDIGFAFLPEFEGKGYAFEGSKRIMDAAIEDFGLTQINAITLPANTSSQKLLEKLGLSLEKSMYLPNDPEELYLYVWRANRDV